MRLAFGMGFLIFDYCMIHYQSLEIVRFRGIMVLMFLWNAIPTDTWSNESGGSLTGTRKCLGFTRPISTFQLATVHMVLTVISALLCFLISANLFLWLLGTSFPLVGPASILVCVVCWSIAIAWSTPAGIGRGMAFLLGNGALMALCLSAFSVTGEPEFWDFRWYNYLTVALLISIAVRVTVAGVQRRRYGESLWDGLQFIRGWRTAKNGSRLGRSDEVTSTELLAKPFRNQWTAQCWYEFQWIKWLLIPVFLLPTGIVAFLSVANYFDPSPSDTFYMVAASLVACPVVYQCCGGVAMTMALHHNDAFPLFSSFAFAATRPLRCDHLVAIKLLLVAVCSFVSWLVMAVAAFLYLRFVGDWESVMAIGEPLLAPVGEISVAWWMIGVVSGLLLLISTTWMLPIFPHLLLIVLGVAGIALVPIVLAGVGTISAESLGNFWTTYNYLIAVGIVAISVFTLQKSIGTGFVGKSYMAATLSIWCAFVCTTVAVAIKLSPVIPSWIPFSGYCLGGALLLVPLAAVVVAPAGLAMHRHG